MEGHQQGRCRRQDPPAWFSVSCSESGTPFHGLARVRPPAAAPAGGQFWGKQGKQRMAEGLTGRSRSRPPPVCSWCAPVPSRLTGVWPASNSTFIFRVMKFTTAFFHARGLVGGVFHLVGAVGAVHVDFVGLFAERSPFKCTGSIFFVLSTCSTVSVHRIALSRRSQRFPAGPSD